MNQSQIDKIVRSSLHIIMHDPKGLPPKGLGTGCFIKFEKFKALFTVAHVTDVEAAACLTLGIAPPARGYPLYSVGAMSYLAKFDITVFEQQLELLQAKPDRAEEIDFGQIDLSFAMVPDALEVLQQAVNFENRTIKIKAGKKITLDHSSIGEPLTGTEYAFFGRIKPLFVRRTPKGDAFETKEMFYDRLKFTRKIGHYYEFEMPSLITDHADFKGTSGAPIMDAKGIVVSLVTHGYEGANKIYGIALSDFTEMALKMLDEENNQ
jgi:hypothetical protein